MKNLCPIIIAALSASLFFNWQLPASTQVPGEMPKGPVALVGGTIHTMTGPAVQNGTIVFSQGKIQTVGKEESLPEGTERIDCAGKQIYPGLFNADGSLGLIEIDAVRATNDNSEAGAINPNVVANVAVNPDSELIPVTRANGVLFAMTSPTGGRISGMASALQLDGWTWEDMTLESRVGLIVHWPNMRVFRSWENDDSGAKQKKARHEALRQLEETFEMAAAYRRGFEANTLPETDLKLQAMLPVMSGQIPVIVDAESSAQIQAAVAFAKRHQLRLIIMGGADAEACAELLKEREVPVMIRGVLRLPLRDSDAYDAAYSLPARLHAAGVRYCICGSARFSASNARNLPYHAATAVAYGLAHDEALRAITRYPAEILGVDDRIGSLAPGKQATLFIADGDILETATHVTAAYIAGRPVDLSSRHTQLWDKYREKQRQAAE